MGQPVPLGSAGSGVEWLNAVATVRVVRRTYRRRRAAAAGVTGVLAAAVVVAGFALADPGGTREGLPAGPTEVPQTIPDGLESTPRGRDLAWRRRLSDWEASNMFSQPGSPGPSWSYSPCDGAAVDTEIAGASDVRTIIQTSPERLASETLVVFPDAGAAVQFVHTARTGAEACEPFVGADYGGMVSVASLPGPWGEGVTVAESLITPESTLEDPVFMPDGESTCRWPAQATR